MGQPQTATVTLLFCDLVDSTKIASRLGDIEADELRHHLFDALREQVTAHRGTEVKNLGDGLMVSFTSNADAVQTAVGMQQATGSVGEDRGLPLQLRVGVSVGEATFEDDDWFGTPVIEAARLCGAAGDGQILISDVVRLLLGTRAEVELTPVSPLELKGLPEPVPACAVEWAPAARRSLDVPLPRVFALAPRYALAGRRDEQAVLQRAWKEAAAGDHRAVFLAGEPGIGKTRLAAEMARQAADDGGVALLGRCDDGLAVPYQPFVDALGHVVAAAPDDELAGLLGPGAGELVRLCPDIASRLPGAAPTSSDPETERYLLFEAVAAWLAAQSRLAPTLLVLDDLHWAADPTLQMLRHLLRSGLEHRVLVVGTYRDTEVDRTHGLSALLGDLRRAEGFTRLGLHGLDEAEVAELLEHASGSSLDERGSALAALVEDETGGNPFFAIEVLVSLAERGAIYQDEDGTWRSDLQPEDIGIPEGVKDVVGQRLGGLPEGCDEVLHAAAVGGQAFELDLLATVVDRSEDEVIDACEAARVAGLLDELGGSPVRFRFAHALVQQTLLDEIPTARRLRLHRAHAEAIEARRAAVLEPYRPALAQHWYEAGTEPAKAFAALVAAAEAALAQLSDREALALLDRAAELESDLEIDPATSIDAAILRGEALRNVGDPSHRQVLLDASAAAEQVGDAPRMARAALANGRGWQSSVTGVDVERVAALDRARIALQTVDAAERDRASYALVLARLAVERIYDFEDRSARALADEALVEARAGGDAASLAQVLFARHNVLMSHDTVDQRRQENEELLALALALGDPGRVVDAHCEGVFWRAQSLDVAGALASADQAFELASSLRQPEKLWASLWLRQALIRIGGHLDEADEVAEQALQVGRDAGVPDAEAMYAFQRTVAICDRAEVAAIDEVRIAVALTPPHFPALAMGMITLELLAGTSPAELRAQLDDLGASAYTPWGENGGPGDGAMSVAANHAVAEAALGERGAHTGSAYDLLDGRRGQLYGNVTWGGPTEAVLAAAAPLVGHGDAVDELLDRALAICTDIEAPLLGMYVRVYGACGLRLRDRPGDRVRADQVLDEAVAMGDQMGAGFARAAASSFPTLQG